MFGRITRLRSGWFTVCAGIAMAACTDVLESGPRIASLVAVAGDAQEGLVGGTLPAPLVVRVEDQFGDPIEGQTVTWAVLSGGGDVTPLESVTGSDGRAQTSFRLGDFVGVQTVQASIAGVSPVTFSATAEAAPPAQLAISAGNGQSGPVGAVLSNALRVFVTDAFDNPSPGVAVSFTVTAGGGFLSAPTATTALDGTASVLWTLGTMAGPQTVTASVVGVFPVIFQATAIAGSATGLVVAAGNAQATAPGTSFADSLVARVVDQYGNGVAGITVTWTVVGPGGMVSPSVVTSDATGRAATFWTLGATGGPNTVRASAAGVSTPATFTGTGLVSYTTINAGERHTCGLSTQDVDYCWGYNGEGQLGIGSPPPGTGSVFATPQPVAVAAVANLTFGQAVAARFHTCALTLSGVGYCWGTNNDGRLGNNTVTPSDVPVQVSTSTTFSTISPGRVHTCGLSLTGRAFCWGYARDGALGIGPVTGDSVLKPVEVAGMLTYQSLTTGRSHSCAVTMGGVAMCWGDNQSGQLGDGTTTGQLSPVATAGAQVFDSISAGGDHTCARATSGAAFCWGSNASGQLGTGSGSTSTPTAVSGGLVFVQLSAGLDHTCGLTASGIAFCWGDNSSGQLGNGGTTSSAMPTAVGGGLTFRLISAGAVSTCGITTAGAAYCWGDNKYGQLGDNTQVDRLLPARVAFQP